MTTNEMKPVSININASVYDEHGDLRHDCTSLDGIIANLDGDEGRNDALRAYVYALRATSRLPMPQPAMPMEAWKRRQRSCGRWTPLPRPSMP